MKKLMKLSLLIFLLLISIKVQAATNITFAWDKVTDAASYNVYQSTVDAFDLTKTKVCTNVTLLTCTVSNVPDGLFWYAATAKDAAGNESGFSNSISFNGDTIPPIKPPNFRVITTVVVTVTIPNP
jgi:fibronectin type 3 domain-containing protein